MDQLTQDVVDDQARRRLVDSALRQGTFTPWEYTRPTTAAQQYMRNHLDLNALEAGSRFPRWVPPPVRAATAHAEAGTDGG